MSLPVAYGLDGGPNRTNWHRNRIPTVVLGTKRYQACCYYDQNLYVVVAVREMPSGEWTAYTYNGSGGRPTLQLGQFDDAHFNTAIGFDSDGYIHFTWSGWRTYNNVGLRYRKSDAPVNSWTGGLSANLAMTGVGESQNNYAHFFLDPVGNLYYTHRDGDSSNANRYLKRYDTSTETWSGVGAANGLIIQGKETKGVYTNVIPAFTPDWDGAGTGRMYYSWNWRKSSAANDYENINMMYWTGSGSTWKKVNGDAQTIPATPANAPTVLQVNLADDGWWPGTAQQEISTNDDGTEVMCVFSRRDGVNPEIFNRLKISSGVVSFDYGFDNTNQRHFHFWDRKKQKFVTVRFASGVVSAATQSSGFTFGAYDAIGSANVENGVAFSFDYDYLIKTGRLVLFGMEGLSASVAPSTHEIGSVIDLPLPSMDFGGNTFTPSLRYNGGAATLKSFRSR
jgi:hypothetical protein